MAKRKRPSRAARRQRRQAKAAAEGDAGSGSDDPPLECIHRLCREEGAWEGGAVLLRSADDAASARRHGEAHDAPAGDAPPASWRGTCAEAPQCIPRLSRGEGAGRAEVTGLSRALFDGDGGGAVDAWRVDDADDALAPEEDESLALPHPWPADRRAVAARDEPRHWSSTCCACAEPHQAEQPSASSSPSPIDFNVTELHASLEMQHLLTIIDEMPAPLDGFAARSRVRTRQIVRLLAHLPEARHFDAALCVRGEEAPDEPYALPVKHTLLVTLHGDVLYFTALILPPAADGEAAEREARLAALLLRIARWQMCHIPEVPRKGAMHVGMPGMFYILGTHLSQHPGAKHEVELFGPRVPCRCPCGCSEARRWRDWRKMMAEVRGVTDEMAALLALLMPTEHARQAAAVENYFTAYADHREVLEAAFLSDQHGFCQSVANKASVGHGDAGNQNQFNVLVFSCPEYMARKFAADPAIDLGVWGMEGGEVYVPFVPRLTVFFNSSASHACVPHRKLLKYMTSYQGMKSKGTQYARECYEEALAAVRADPKLMEGFAHEEDAAWYQSSIVGSTTFQQRAVTHQLLRAAAAAEPSRVLRPVPELVAELAHELALEPPPELSPEEAAEAKAQRRREAKAQAKAADAERRARLGQLVAGSRVCVQCSGDSHVGRIVETPTVALDPKDTRVLVQYPDEDGPMTEWLGQMAWELLPEMPAVRSNRTA